jgi:hypothetical protein
MASKMAVCYNVLREYAWAQTADTFFADIAQEGIEDQVASYVGGYHVEHLRQMLRVNGGDGITTGTAPFLAMTHSSVSSP